jgi:hypothetical protein
VTFFHPALMLCCSAGLIDRPFDTTMEADSHAGKGYVYSRWHKSRFLKFLKRIFTTVPVGIEIFFEDGRYKG